jgi:hypothetical protein
MYQDYYPVRGTVIIRYKTAELMQSCPAHVCQPVKSRAGISAIARIIDTLFQE